MTSGGRTAGLIARVLTVLAGIWLMAAPAILGYADPASASDRIVGPLAATVGTIALWEVARPLRWVGLVLGAWLLCAPWVLGYGGAALLSASACGVLLIGCAIVPGDRENRIGGGWWAILDPERQARRSRGSAGTRASRVPRA